MFSAEGLPALAALPSLRTLFLSHTPSQLAFHKSQGEFYAPVAIILTTLLRNSCKFRIVHGQVLHWHFIIAGFFASSSSSFPLFYFIFSGIDWSCHTSEQGSVMCSVLLKQTAPGDLSDTHVWSQSPFPFSSANTGESEVFSELPFIISKVSGELILPDWCQSSDSSN